MKRMLLDNSAVNSLVAGTDHSQVSELYDCLVRMQRAQVAEVFAIPTNVIEVALCPESNKRHFMAKRLNDLIDGKRVLPSFEFAVLSDFCRIAHE